MTTTVTLVALVTMYLTIAIMSVVAFWPSRRRGEKLWFVIFASATWIVWLCALALYCLWEAAKERLAK
jgi:hypothetical protein